MDVTCNSCGAKLKIPDSKLPPPHMLLVTLTCPKCKKKIIIDKRGPAQGPPAQKKAEAQPAKEPAPQKKATAKPAQGPPAQKAEVKPENKPVPQRKIEIDPEKEAALKKVEEMQQDAFDYEEDAADLLMSLEKGAKLALILDGDNERKKEIKPVVERLSYKPIMPKSIREAMGRLLFHHFDLIILSDGFDGVALDDTPIVQYLNHVSMSIRRRIFLVLLSNKFRTMDSMQAFGRSANLVVNLDDLSNFSVVLKKAISDHDKFYKVFMDTLQEIGKD